MKIILEYCADRKTPFAADLDEAKRFFQSGMQSTPSDRLMEAYGKKKTSAPIPVPMLHVMRGPEHATREEEIVEIDDDSGDDVRVISREDWFAHPHS